MTDRNEHPHDHHTDEQLARRAVDRTIVDRKTWSPAQLVAGAMGLFLVVMGAVAIIRNGFDNLVGESATVLGFEHTVLMGIIDLVVGLFFLGAAGTAMGSRSGLTTLGLLALAFGLIVAIEPEAMSESLGGGQNLGWLYAVIGAISLVAAWASPTIQMRRSSTQRAVDLSEATHS